MAEARICPIVLADDDEDDVLLALDALNEVRLANDVKVVRDGVELMEMLRGRSREDLPQLILLDLNMPRKDGRQVLEEMREDPDLRAIPVVVLTTSTSPEDLQKAYDLGANSYISKPVTFHGLVEAMKVVRRYWFEIVERPPS